MNHFLVVREDLGLPLKVMLGILPILFLLGLWWLLTAGDTENRVISPLILPSPVEVVKQIPALWFQAELSRSLIASALRVIGGFLVAVVIVFPLGVLMGSFTKVRAIFDPLMIFGAYLPIPTLVPLTMSLFGIGETQKVMFLAIAFIVFLLPMFVKAIGEVDDIYLQTAQTLGASKWQLVRHVLVGISMPKLYQALRLGFGIGWTYIILAEMVAAERGLGEIIIIAQRRGPREFIYLVLVVIVIVAYITDKIWMWFGRLLFPYCKNER
ncbi:MAG: ABC transporter permease subunit [bacterium]|nr:ABC transporter permease subunit [Candidatus Sumerlaeota bacterium]